MFLFKEVKRKISDHSIIETPELAGLLFVKVEDLLHDNSIIPCALLHKVSNTVNPRPTAFGSKKNGGNQPLQMIHTRALRDYTAVSKTSMRPYSI
jgi:hypothetical protein